MFYRVGFSNCTNPIVEDAISQANDDIMNGNDPGGSLNSLTSVVDENELASGNIIQLQDTVVLAIERQSQLIAEDPDPISRDLKSKNFTKSVVDLSDVMMTSTEAFWGLETIARDEAINRIQTSVNDTLFLLAENFLDEIYQYMESSYQTLGKHRFLSPCHSSFANVLILSLQPFKWRTKRKKITTTKVTHTW